MAMLLEVIEWFDETRDVIVHRIPETGSADIKFGTQLIVRENQAGVFFRDGKAYDLLAWTPHIVHPQHTPPNQSP